MTQHQISMGREASRRHSWIRGMAILLTLPVCSLMGLPKDAGSNRGQLTSLSASSGWITNGMAVAVATGDQAYSQQCPDGFGGAILVWEDGRGEFKRVFAQRLSSSGQPLWAFEGIPVSTAQSAQWRPQVVPDAEGGAIVTWFDYRNGNSDVFAQRIDPDGNLDWAPEGIAVATGTQGQWSPRIARDGVGGAVIVWEEDFGGTHLNLLAQRINSNGSIAWGGAKVVCGASSNQESPQIALASSESVIVVWLDRRSGNIDVYAQRLDASGNPVWIADGKAIASGSGNQTAPVIESDGAAGAVIAWESDSGGSWDLYAQRINASGAELWTPGGVSVSSATGHQTAAAITGDGTGGVILAWSDQRGASADIFAQRITGTGAGSWTTDGVAVCMASGDQIVPVITSTGNGGAVIAWRDARNVDLDIFAQFLDQDGTLLRAQDGIAVGSATNNQEIPAITGNDIGGAIVSWTDQRGGSRDVYAMRIGPIKIQGSVSVDYFYAPSQEHVAFGLSGVSLQAVESGTQDVTDEEVTSSLSGDPSQWGLYELTVVEGWTGTVQISDVPYPVWNSWTPNGMAFDQLYADQTLDFTLTHGQNSSWLESGLPVAQTSQPVTSPKLITDGTGGMIATWLDSRNGNWDIFTQRVYKDGDTFWSPGGISLCTAPGEQSSVQLAPNGYEGAIVCWLDNRSGSWDLYKQAINGWGDVVWEANGRPVAQGVSNLSPPAITTDAAGAPTIVYQRGADLHARVHASGELAVCTAGGEQSLPQITYNPPGQIAYGAIVAWVDKRSDATGDIYAQRFDYVTESIDSQWPLNGKAVCTVAGAQAAPFAIYDIYEGAFITWIDFRSGDGNVYAQRISQDAVYWWSSNGVPLCSATGLQTSHHAVSDGEGGMVVVWEDWRDPNQADIYAQRVNGYGVVQWAANGVLVSGATGNQTSPRITHDGSGNFVIAWADDRTGTSDIYAQRLSPTGSPLGQANGFVVNSALGSQAQPQIIGERVSDSGTYFAWVDARSGVDALFADRLKPGYSISGYVRDEYGAGVEGITIDALEKRDLLSLVPFASTVTDFVGYYEIPVEDGWRGIVRPQPTEWFDTITPGEYGHEVTSDITGQDYTAIHTGEDWANEWATGIPICVQPDLQSNVAAISDGAGGMICVWSDERSDDGDVYIQRMDGDGEVLWTADGGVVAAENGIQGAPAIAEDGYGGAIIVWGDSRAGTYDIYVQRVFPGGGVHWPGGKVLCQTAGGQNNPSLIRAADGTFVTAWEDHRGNATEIYAQKFSLDGVVEWGATGRQVTTEFSVPPGQGTPGGYYNKSRPVLAQDDTNGALIAWINARPIYDVDGNVGEARSLRALKVAGNGTIPWGPGDGQGVVVSNAGHLVAAEDPRIARTGSNGVFLSYARSVSSNYVCTVASISLGNGSVGTKYSPFTTAKAGVSFDLVADQGTGVLLTFAGISNQILMQRFNSGGLMWPSDLVVGNAQDAGAGPRPCFVDDDILMLAWGDDGNNKRGMYAQKVEILENGDGSVLWEQDGVALAKTPSQLNSHAIVPLGSDKAGSVWSTSDPGTSFNIYGQLIQDLNVHSLVTTNVPANGFLFTCPRGSQDGGTSSEFQVTVSLHDESRFTFDPENIDLEFGFPSGGSVAFFSEDPLDPQWEPVGNVLRTSIGRRNIGGYGPFEIPVSINGEQVGEAHLSVRSPDFNADGSVSTSDFAFFSTHYSSPPKPYEPRADFNGDGLVSVADFSMFSMHYNHTNTGGGSAPAVSEGEPQMLLSIQPLPSDEVGGPIQLELWIDESEPVDGMIGAMTFDDHALQFMDWKPSATAGGTQIVAPGVRDGRPVLFIGVWGAATDDKKRLELGTVTLGVRDGASLPSQSTFSLAFGDVQASDGRILKLGGVQIQGTSNRVALRNVLAQNYPNPFNLSTTIEYSLARNGHVDLSIYNVSGQLVRTLVNETLPANQYRLAWDGRNDHGVAVAPGAYFYRIHTQEFVSTKKMVLLR